MDEPLLGFNKAADNKSNGEDDAEDPDHLRSILHANAKAAASQSHPYANSIKLKIL